MAHLFHLVRFGICAKRLQIENLLDSVLRENVMAATNSLIKT